LGWCLGAHRGYRLRGAQAGLRPLALDGDRLGGGLDVTLSLEQECGVRWPDLAGARGSCRWSRAAGTSVVGGGSQDPLVQLPKGCSSVSRDRPGRAPCAPRCSGCAGGRSSAPRSSDLWALASSVEAMVLLAGSGICDLAGASAIAQHLTAACPDGWLCLRTSGKRSLSRTRWTEPRTCLWWLWSVRNPAWMRTYCRLTAGKFGQGRTRRRGQHRAGSLCRRRSTRCLVMDAGLCRSRFRDPTQHCRPG
jgi:hypothetical protein